MLVLLQSNVYSSSSRKRSWAANGVVWHSSPWFYPPQSLVGTWSQGLQPFIMCIQEVRLHFLCCHKTRCKVTQLLIRLERIDPVLNNSSYVLHYSFVILHTFFPASLRVVLSSIFRGCGTCQFLTLATVLSTVRSKYHPLEYCSRLHAYADDSTLGLGVLVDGDFNRLVMVCSHTCWLWIAGRQTQQQPVADELWDV